MHRGVPKLFGFRYSGLCQTTQLIQVKIFLWILDSVPIQLHTYIYRYVYSRPIPRLSRSCQVTLSKFHALNFKIASCLPFWTVLKKVHKFRQTQSGDAAGEQEDEENNQGDDRDGTTGDVQQQGQDTSIDNLLSQLKKLQRQRSTFDLVCSIFADNRVRQLGYMLLT